MNEHPEPDRPAPSLRSAGEAKQGYLERRRERIRAEVQRNRQGGHAVPTWVMALALALMVGAWLYLIISS